MCDNVYYHLEPKEFATKPFSGTGLGLFISKELLRYTGANMG
jgi:signal transduction histidine kinase